MVALLLIGVGTADLVRAALSGPRRRQALAAGAAGAGAMVLLALAAGLTSAADLALLGACSLLVLAWVGASGTAAERGRGHGLAIAVLLLGGFAIAAGAGWSSPAGGLLERWLHWTGLPQAAVPVDRALLVLGAGLVQLATANTVVRLVLASTGAIKPAGQPQPSDQLRGGRLLGPMERILILGLGLAGDLTAAGIVIAAKGLIRWPELQAGARGRSHPEHDRDRDRDRDRHRDRGHRDAGHEIHEITEYFLVGSFVSWLVALASLWLVGPG